MTKHLELTFHIINIIRLICLLISVAEIRLFYYQLIFLILFSDGIAYTFGVLLEKLVVHFDSNRATVSWVGSLLCGVYLMSGPIVGGLVNKFGCRPVCILGKE